MMQESQARSSIKTQIALNLLDDFAEIGIRSVSLVSDGESTLSKAYVPFIQHAASLGIDVGNATNAWEWEPEKIEQVLPHLTWVRFTVAAGRPESYASIMYKGPEHTKVFDRAIKHIKYAVDLKKRKGLAVIMPTTAHDAKGMLIAAIEDDNPVLFIEHRWLHHVKDNVPETYYRVPIGKARVLQEGTDVTIAAFSYMVFEAVIAARALLTAMGLHVEVIDMRSVRPLDVDTVLESVRKTGRLIVADTGFKTGSIAGELISQVTEQAFNDLNAAPIRIASPDHPTPTSPFMAEHYYPSPQTIADAVLDLMGANKNTDDYRKLSDLMIRNGPHDAPNREFSGPF